MKLSKTYEPNQYESDIYALWEKSEAFIPKARGSRETYSIVMPPPNANANLHIGYGLSAGLEDIAARYHRMKGEATLLLPGADHAGFETQSVYEKHLAKEGKSRFDFKREELYSQIWDFVALNRGNFEQQIRQLGISCDWTQYTFTLDDKIVGRAYKTFKQLWDDGLIYRGERLVNYCTFHGTGFADIEVEHKDATTPLYYMKYGPFELATTRPETKFGDTAVAVHPDDERYKQYVNTVITVEGFDGPFELRVVADEMVDPNFGTGAVKITPAHDFNDFEVAQRHNLEAVRVINHDGKLNQRAGKYAGMTVLEARQAVTKDLDKKGLLVKVDKDYKNRVGVCYKCGTVIEPMLMEQWFVNMEPLAKRAIEALQKNKITFYPNSKKDQLITYLKGLRDWNISRQIAWGIPIPAFQNVD
ncbi:MAG: class I tRNA ligase family protein, partial [Candidatus Saccharimonadales bacterium]